MGAVELIPRAETVREVVGLAVGGGSTCWESMAGAGTFQDQDAAKITDLAVAKINDLQMQAEADPGIVTGIHERLDWTIQACADALLAACAAQTGMDPDLAAIRARQAISQVMARAKQENIRG